VSARSTATRGGLAVLFAAMALGACGGGVGKSLPMYVPSDGSSPPITGLGGQIGTDGGGTDASSGAAGTILVDAGTPNGSVEIVIKSPAADSLLSTNSTADVAALVTIKGGTDVVDPSTVRASLTPAVGSVAVSTSPLVSTTTPDLYTGRLSLSGLATGDYTLTVTARSSTNALGTASVKVKLDGGPKITVISPVPGRHYKGSLIVQAVIDPGPYPPASAIASSIAGTPIALAATSAANVYRAAFDLTMPNALVDDQVFEISAKDGKGTTTTIKFTFNVDVVGPTIAMTQPVPGAIVGQVIRLSAMISDSAGVDASTAQVLIGDKANPQFKLPLSLDSTGAFSTLFDTKLLTQCKLPPSQSLCIVRPTISFRAADALGNESTISYEIAVDNIPPIADLVPPKIRASKIDEGLRCSFEFDPLSRDLYSGDAPNDGCRVPQLFDFRARIQDDGNRAAGIKQVPIAEVDPNLTAGYVLVDTSQPLVVDIDGDGNCDTINPKLIPTTTPLTGPRQVLKVRFKPVPPAGSADFRMDPALPNNLGCLPGKDTDPPLDICHVENPTAAISYSGGKLPAIWAAEPIAPDDPQYCFGSQLDTLANNVPDSSTTPAGWRCIAVATADKNGNLSTSMPIRVWVDYTYQGSYAFCDHPPSNAPPMPSCTGTYDKATDTVSAKACTARGFTLPAGSPIEVCFNHNCN
jgi:hypothetical protein